MKLSWLFIEDRLGRWQGLNDGATTHFAQNPIGSLAKEIIQNSLDARQSDDMPVIVDFDLFQIPDNEFPDIRGLRDKISRSLATPRNIQDERTRKALELANNKISKSKLDILKICEKNTKGMVGPYYDDTSSFYAYTKGAGLSGKSEGLGSFGIGKKAPVVNSAIRTVFVSTRFENSRKFEEFYCQGMSFWVTDVRDSLKFEGNGYCGDQGNPVTSIEEVPQWLKKNERGTNIYVCAPLFGHEWKELLVSSVLTTFFMAIHYGKLEVSVGEYKIDKKALPDLFVNPDLIRSLESLEDDGPLTNFRAGHNFYRCLTDINSIKLETQIQNPIGNFIIHLLVEENLPKQVGFLRDGMFITSELKAQGIKKFAMTKDFVALAYCGNHIGNSILREMEPPQHNDFWPNSYHQVEGPKLINAIGKKIRDQLNKYISPEYEGVKSIDFLADLLGAERGKNEKSANGPIDFNPEGRVVQSVKAIMVPNFRKKSSLQVNIGDEGGVEQVGETDNESDGGSLGVGERPAEGGDEGIGNTGSDSQDVDIVAKDPRVVYTADGLVNVYLTIGYIGAVVVKFYIAGQDFDELIKVDWTNKGVLYDGGVRLISNGDNERLSLMVRLLNVSKESLMVGVYEI